MGVVFYYEYVIVTVLAIVVYREVLVVLLHSMYSCSSRHVVDKITQIESDTFHLYYYIPRSMVTGVFLCQMSRRL